MGTILPPELVDMAIDYLHKDKKALCTCSLVCKSWINSSRFHLFNTISVPIHPHVDGFDRFLRFLETTSSVHSFIRSLRFVGAVDHDYPYPEPPLKFDVVGKILDKLPRLQDFELDAIAWPALELQPIPPRSRSVKSLTVSHVAKWIFEDIHSMFDILHLFPSVESFWIKEISSRRFLESSPEPMSPHHQFPADFKLQKLTLETTKSTFWYCHCARSIPLFHSLTSLSICRIEIQDIRDLGDFLADISRTLTDFTLRLSEIRFIDEEGQPNPVDLWPLLNLNRCTSLKTFSLFIPMDDDPELPGPQLDYYPYWDSVMPILCQLQPSVRRIQLGIELVSDEEWLIEILENVDWDRLHKIFNSLAKLEEVKFCRQSKWDNLRSEKLPRWTKRCIRVGLAALQNKGKLKIY